MRIVILSSRVVAKWKPILTATLIFGFARVISPRSSRLPGTIQEILKNREITAGIFSHTRPIAKAFLEQIKNELADNEFLKQRFPDVLWADPSREAPSWSLDGGIVVKRKSNPKEKTLEAWGLVDGQPTSKHYQLLIYDDVVVEDSVGTPEQINKTTKALELSFSLGVVDGGRRWMAGTPYHFYDTYRTVIDRGTAKVRRYPITEDGTPTGKPVLVSQAKLDILRRDRGPYTFSCQYLLNPIADEAQGFKEEWLNYYDGKLDPRNMNVYLLVDPASAKKEKLGLHVDDRGRVFA